MVDFFGKLIMFPNILAFCVCIQICIPDSIMATRIASRWRLFWIHFFFAYHPINIESCYHYYYFYYIFLWRNIWFVVLGYEEKLCSVSDLFVFVVVITQIFVVLFFNIFFFDCLYYIIITTDYPFSFIFFLFCYKNLSCIFAGV